LSTSVSLGNLGSGSLDLVTGGLGTTGNGNPRPTAQYALSRSDSSSPHCPHYDGLSAAVMVRPSVLLMFP
jgi:hypothetical protein